MYLVHPGQSSPERMASTEGDPTIPDGMDIIPSASAEKTAVLFKAHAKHWLLPKLNRRELALMCTSAVV